MFTCLFVCLFVCFPIQASEKENILKFTVNYYTNLRELGGGGGGGGGEAQIVDSLAVPNPLPKKVLD